jgi:hypothetical protein
MIAKLGRTIRPTTTGKCSEFRRSNTVAFELAEEKLTLLPKNYAAKFGSTVALALLEPEHILFGNDDNSNFLSFVRCLIIGLCVKPLTARECCFKP